MDNRDLAKSIYDQCYGHLDDRRFRDEAIGAIKCWLDDGEPVTTETVEELAREWREYNDGASDALALNLR